LNFFQQVFGAVARELALSNIENLLRHSRLGFYFLKKYFYKKNKIKLKECLVSTFPNMSMNGFRDIMIVYMLLLLTVVVV